MGISVIIPVLNEAGTIGPTIAGIKGREGGRVAEVIVADGGSADETTDIAAEAGARVIRCEVTGRAAQMNRGARVASQPVLYFLHADSLPPAGFDEQILRSIAEGYPAGCFQLGFDSDHPILRFYAWCTRFDIDAFRFGDQSLYITRELFDEIGRFDPHLTVMEDNEMVRRIKRSHPYKILPGKVITSSRKYRANGVVRLQLIFSLIYVLFFLGLSQEKLVSIYKTLIDDGETTAG